MKNFLLGVLTTLVILIFGIFAFLRLGLAEVREDLPASRLESSLMSSAVRASVRRLAPEVPNPVAPTEENLIAGGKIYLGECSGCHGEAGKPDRAAATSLYPPIPPARGSWNPVHRSANLLDRRARYPQNRHVRQR